MLILFKTNGNGLEFQVKVNWQSLKAVLRTTLTLMTLLLSILLAPEISRLASLLGW